jgi:hypothetical protein
VPRHNQIIVDVLGVSMLVKHRFYDQTCLEILRVKLALAERADCSSSMAVVPIV